MLWNFHMTEEHWNEILINYLYDWATWGNNRRQKLSLYINASEKGPTIYRIEIYGKPNETILIICWSNTTVEIEMWVKVHDLIGQL